MTTVHVPTLETARLTLRGATRDDFGPFANMLASPRARYMGGPFDRPAAWALFTDAVACWQLNGFGGWIVTDRTTGAFRGDVAIVHPHHFPEPELGWTLTEQAEGQGYALEAASAALEWYWHNTKAQTLVSYITPGNIRSENLARKLGANPDPAAPLPDGETSDDTEVFRHAAPSLFEKNPPRRADPPDARGLT
jgi:RimJ/RimL family protein N-acetyltransferase